MIDKKKTSLKVLKRPLEKGNKIEERIISINEDIQFSFDKHAVQAAL